jgi:tight adherence protein B
MSLIKTLVALSPILALGFWIIGRDSRNQKIYNRLSHLAIKTDVHVPYFRLFNSKSFNKSENKLALLVLAITLATGIFLDFPHWLTLLMTPIATVLTWSLARRQRLSKIRHLFAERFPEVVASLTRAVQAGVPVEKALASLCELYDGELSRRFSHLIHQIELGVPFREALNNFSTDLDMPDVDFFCSILALNRESGSKLSPMLISLGETLRARKAVNRKLQALTSESRGAARILTALPFFVLAVEALLNPRQIMFLLSDPSGRAVLGYCAISMWLGLVIIRRMSRLLED